MTNRHIEVVTTNTTGMMETTFGTVETSNGIYEILKAQYTHVTFIVADLDQDQLHIGAPE
ncbi:MAG: hypothetical protein JKX91_02170 [Rhizobiaceae bacterium]|nr:hypothetical protein [Rhizobiaceae bacterium]